jgi:ketosteroid isomerase-like protein
MLSTIAALNIIVDQVGLGSERLCRVPEDQREGVYPVQTALSVVQQAYAAFRRQDIRALLELVGEQIDWDFIVPSNLPYAGRRRNRQQISDFFAAVECAEEFHAFEPREFIEAGEHVTVIGWLSATSRDTKKKYEGEWVHVFTVINGKIVHWRGFATTKV